MGLMEREGRRRKEAKEKDGIGGKRWEETARKGMGRNREEGDYKIMAETTGRVGIGWICKGRKGTRRMCWDGVKWDKNRRIWDGKRKRKMSESGGRQ